MTMNISTLPVLPKGEATHTKRIEDGAAEFDVKMLLKSKMSVNTSWSLEADIEEKSQPVADEQVAPDNTGTSPIDMHQVLDPTQIQPAANLPTDSPPTSSRKTSSPAVAWSFTPDTAVKVQTALQASPEQLLRKGSANPVEQLLHKDSAKPVEQLLRKDSANPVEQLLHKDSANPVEQLPHKDSANPVEQLLRKDSAKPVEQLLRKDSAKPVEQLLRKGSANPVEQLPHKDSAKPVEQLPHKDSANPIEQLRRKDSANPVEQVAVKAETMAAKSNSPPITDVLSKTHLLNQFAAAPVSGSVPQPRAVPLQSATSISGQFTRSARTLPSSGPVAPAPGKIEVSLFNEAIDPMDRQVDTMAKFTSNLNRANVPTIDDRLNGQPMMPLLSGGNLQSVGPGFAAVLETPERQIIDAIDDEVSAVGARLKAQAAVGVESPASGKLPMLSQIKVDLNPGSLGAVRIEIAMSASGEVEVNVVTAKETTAMMIERGRDEVLGGLQSRNVEVRGFSINTAETGSGTQAGSQQESSAARFSGHGEGQQSRHVPNAKGDGEANDTGPEKGTTDEETLRQAVRHPGSGIYV